MKGILMGMCITLLVLSGCSSYTQIEIPMSFYIENQESELENIERCMEEGERLNQERVGTYVTGGRIVSSHYRFDGMKCEGDKCLCW